MKEPKEIAFQFQEVALVEAQNIVAAGDGKYSDLLIMLTQKLPELDNANRVLDISERKGIAFGLPNGKEVDEKDRRGLCHVVNLRLNKAGIGWRISYSGNKKLFILVPRIERTAKTRGSTNEKADYIPVRKYQLKYKAKMNAESLVDLAKGVLNFHGEFDRSLDSRVFRGAVAVVGQKDLHIVGSRLDAALGFKKGASNFFLHRGKTNVELQVNALRRALKQKGVIQ